MLRAFRLIFLDERPTGMYTRDNPFFYSNRSASYNGTFLYVLSVFFCFVRLSFVSVKGILNRVIY